MKKIAFLLILVAAFSCKKKDSQIENECPTPPTPIAATSNDVRINITHMVDNVIVQVTKDTAYNGLTPKYINANTDTFSVTKFMYYISNIRLKKSDGTWFIEPNSYRLINAADSNNTCKFDLKTVPVGNYVEMEFLIGVDSLRNTSGAQTGALDPAKDMYWNWNSGYIFFKFEGYSSSVNNALYHNIGYHIGGFATPNNNIKKVSIPLTSTNLIVVGDNVSKIYLKTNVNECFRTPLITNFSAQPNITQLQLGYKIADNYADMFSLSAVKN